jgi:hypothetical protein
MTKLSVFICLFLTLRAIEALNLTLTAAPVVTQSTTTTAAATQATVALVASASTTGSNLSQETWTTITYGSTSQYSDDTLKCTLQISYNVTTTANDICALQYALTIQNLELAFYTFGLNTFTAADFASCGYP